MELEDLVAWQKARSFRLKVRQLIKSLPESEKYNLASQLTRSSRSTTANTAEGHGRFHYQENIQFCRQARGSLIESLDHLYVAFDEGYISDDELKELRIDIIEIRKVLNGYIKFLNTKKTQG